MFRCANRVITLILLLFSAASFGAETFRLTEFYAGDSLVRLQGSSAAESLSIPLSSIAEVETATINLTGASSIALLKHRSILNVRFNNATIDQIPLDPASPFINEEVTIPAELWRKGFNNLTFQVSQHFTEACEDVNATELWSEIDLYRSSLSIQTKDNITALTIDDLAGFFSPGIGSQQQVSIATITGDEKAITSDILPLVAQGLALRNEYKPLSFSVLPIAQPAFPALPADTDWSPELEQRFSQSSWYITPESEQLSVLVATKSALAGFVKEDILEEITGPYIGMEAVEGFTVASKNLIPAARRLIISGTTLEELKLAAATLVVMDDALNPDAAIVVNSQSPLNTRDYLNHTVLQPDNAYTFADMNGSGVVFRGAGIFKHQVAVNLPADFYTPESATAHLYLDFAYGAENGPGSVMSIAINGELIHGLPLNAPNGQSFNKYRLDIPSRHFTAGPNTISFEVTQRSPQSENACTQIPGSHLVFQLHPTSTLELPEAGSVATQPDLALFSSTTFPFSTSASDTPATVYYSQPEMLGSALTLIGKLAQVEKTLNPSLKAEQGIPSQTSPLAIVLATPAELNAAMFDDYAVTLTNSKKWSYQLQNSMHRTLQEVFSSDNKRDIVEKANTQQQSSLGELGVLIMKENEDASSPGSLMIIASESAEILTQRVEDLIGLSLWGQLNGDFFVWKNSEKPELAMRLASQYEIGEPTSKWLEYRMWLSNHPWYWIIAVLVIVILGSVLSYIALKRRNKELSSSW